MKRTGQTERHPPRAIFQANIYKSRQQLEEESTLKNVFFSLSVTMTKLAIDYEPEKAKQEELDENCGSWLLL